MSTSSKILALETAVGSGSVAIVDRTGIVAEIDGDVASCSRAEELLGIIQILMKRIGSVLSDLNTIAISIGPGSYSGIRIGVSTAIGLKNALGIECRGVSLLEAIAFSSKAHGVLVTAVPVGKNDVAWQRFDKSNTAPNPLSPPRLLSVAEFTKALTELDRLTVNAPRMLLELIGRQALEHDLVAADDASTLAGIVGRNALTHPTAENLRPLYLQRGTGF